MMAQGFSNLRNVESVYEFGPWGYDGSGFWGFLKLRDSAFGCLASRHEVPGNAELCFRSSCMQFYTLNYQTLPFCRFLL